MTGPAKINHVSTKIACFLSLLYHNYITIYINKTNVYYVTTNAEFNGLSFAIYRNEILQSQPKILVKITIVFKWLIFCRPGHSDQV